MPSFALARTTQFSHQLGWCLCNLVLYFKIPYLPINTNGTQLPPHTANISRRAQSPYEALLILARMTVDEFELDRTTRFII